MEFSVRTWLAIGILYICYIVYGTLLPFNFTFSLEMIATNWGNIEWIERYGRQFYTTKNVDAIVNFLFFVPLGIIIYAVRYSLNRRQHSFINIILATVSGLILSIIIEFFQLLIKERTTSFIDIITNTAGCLSGAMIVYIIHRVLPFQTRQRVRTYFKNLPDIIFILPILFIGLFLTEGLSSYFLESEKVGNSLFNWQYIIQPLWIWQVLCVYVPLGILATGVIRKALRNYALPVIHLVSIISALLISGMIEIIKLYLYTKPLLTINLIYGILGIINGVAISEVIHKDGISLNDRDRRRMIYILLGIFIFFGSLIIYKFLYPFSLILSRSYIFEKTKFFLFSVHSFIPFNGIQKLFIYSLQNIVLFIPIGIIIKEIEPYIHTNTKTSIFFIISILLISIPLVLQIINQNQTPFLYGLPTNALGIFIGYILWYGFRKSSMGENK